MKVILLVLLFAVCQGRPPTDIEKEWEKFKGVSPRMGGDPEEEKARKQVFISNVQIIDAHNKLYDAGLVSFELGINDFTDLTWEEFSKHRLINSWDNLTLEESEPIEPYSLETVPDSVNWTAAGAVSDVEDQGSCGSCWAFSATGSIEGQYFLKSGHLLDLSEQYLIDCCSPPNAGCNGGVMQYAFQYIKDHGIPEEYNYLYTGRDDPCKNVKKSPVKVTGYINVGRSEEALKNAVANIGPISVAITATKFFQAYKNGIFSDLGCRNKRPNHGVLVVGYGSEGGRDYWLIKNSWGTNWGIKGYMKLARNEGNMCSVASYGTYPLLG